MEKRATLFILILILSVGFVSAAQVDKDKALSWINQNINVNSNIRDVSLALLALQSSNYSSKIQTLITGLQARMDELGCFPKGNCNVRDTSLALIALQSYAKPVDKTAKWLQDSSSSSGSFENWFIQVTTKNSGSCILSSGNSVKNITINDNQNTDCGSPWISVGPGQCFELGENVISEVTVDCSSLDDPDVKISLLKVNGNEFTILSQPQGSYVTLLINNACWGQDKDSSCDLDSTAYAYWALSKYSRIEEPPFLATAQNKDALHYSILYQITNQNAYYKWLIENQGIDGSWSDQSVFKTTVAINSLLNSGNLTKSTNWLASQQRDTGSFNNDVGDTAAVVYFTTLKSSKSSSIGAIGYCGDDFADSDLGEECDGEDDDACPRQCTSSCKCPVKEEACVTQDDCTPLYCDATSGRCVECLRNSDCSDNEVCNANTNSCESIEITPRPEPSKGFPFGTLFTIMGIIIVIVAIYFVYNRFLKKTKPTGEKPAYLKDNKPKPSNVVAHQKPVKRYNPQDQHLEEELDRSIREAQQLLKRK